MPVIKWSDLYSVGIKSFDDEHKQLVEILNKFTDISTVEDSKDEVLKLFNELVEFTLKHFYHEEEVMRRHEFPDLADHINVHNDLREKVSTFITGMSADPSGEVLNLVSFLIEWIEDHLNDYDKHYSEYLISKGVT